MRLLGAVLAGGAGRRFGGDKALAEIEGQTLIARVIEAQAPQTHAIVICGRELPPWRCVSDRPSTGLGPLAGIAAALHYGDEHGFDAVLTAPCDTPFLPADLADRLAGGGPAFLARLPLVGFWPCALKASIDRELAEARRSRSVRAWAERHGARAVESDPIANVNTPTDLAALDRR